MPPDIAVPEAIRLVVWDLDDTFWRGTISEGAIDYIAEHHALVVELARRGIMSSICSKNDESNARARLEQEQIWDYFIFPSINWQPKGERLRTLIEDVQLRPESVLFIDDNPLNLAEAQHYVPGIQVSDERVIPKLLAMQACRGKDDAALSRLAQYRLLEKRKADEAVAAQSGASNRDFLRASNIRIAIDYDVGAHLDRAIELINRTNQLNFTKQRLPEDNAAARAKLAALVAKHNRLSGLVRVQDDYGDYGYCGVFVVAQSRAAHRFIHFAFSCRILNMGVENWVYQYLKQPRLNMVGEVVSNPAEEGDIDWIKLVEHGDGGAEQAVEKTFDLVRLRGSCDLRPVAHFFGACAHAVGAELTYVRDGLVVRPDNSVLLAHAARGVDAETLALAEEIGLSARELDSGMFDDGPGRNIYVLSLKADARNPVYRHRLTGKLFPLSYVGRAHDVRAPGAGLPKLPPERASAILARLEADYDYVGRTPVAVFAENLEFVLSRLPKGSLVFFLKLNERKPTGELLKRARDYNRVAAALADAHPNVVILSIVDHIEDEKERRDANHFDRQVYHRFFEHLRRIAGERLGSAGRSAGSAELAAAA